MDLGPDCNPGAFYGKQVRSLSLAPIVLRKVRLIGKPPVLKTGEPSTGCGFVQMAESILRVLALPESFATKFNDAEKYQYCRYRISLKDSILFNRMLVSIENSDLKAKAIIDRTKKLIKYDEWKEASHVFQKISGLKMSDKKLFEDFKHTELRLLAEKKEVSALEQRMKEVSFDPDQKNEMIYYNALIQQENSKQLDVVTRNFEWLASANPYFDEAISNRSVLPRIPI